MPADSFSPYLPHAREAALRALAASAAGNVPGVEFASITVLREDQTLYTVAATEPLASEFDTLQYELGEGPCLAAVTEQRFVLVNTLLMAIRTASTAPRPLSAASGRKRRFRSATTASKPG